MTLDMETLREAVSGAAAAFRCVTDYQPAGGSGDKVFPPTYEGGKYATEERIDPGTGEVRSCVLLDSVQSQANRMELALLEAHRAGEVNLPLIVTRFDQEELPKKFAVTSLEAPHRAADALFRDSLLNGVKFRRSDRGCILDSVDVRNATALFGLCPTALVFGLWDSTGPRGGLGAKFQRALVSEIVGFDAVPGKDTASRMDPAQIMHAPGVTLYRRDESRDDAPDWTVDKSKGSKPVGRGPQKGRPAQANHGNVTPDYAFARDRQGQIVYDTVENSDGGSTRKPRILGGFTISRATQTTVLSLAALRRLRFPLDGADPNGAVDRAAHTALTALGLAAGTLARSDVDLRSRCQLFAETGPVWQLLDRPGKPPREFDLDHDAALRLLTRAVEEAREAGLPWEEVPLELTPSPDLVELVRRSQEWARDEGAEDD